MPRLPGVPTLDPVNQPTINPSEAGRVGESIAGLGEVSEDAAYQQQGLNLFIKKAQEHVDVLAARNQLDAAYTQMQDGLAKTQNSRDVPDVIQQANKNLNDISAQWSKSPAAIAIQMDADGLRPSMQHVGTVRQVDLMGKEFKVSINQQGERLAGDYASGNRDAATAAFNSAVDGGVSTGLVGDVEAGEMKRQFQIAGQGLQVKMALQSPDPKTNMDMVTQLEDHPENFPDLRKEDISDFISKGTSAFETHTRQKEWADQQLVMNTVAPAIIQNNTDEQGSFHLDQALKQASHLTPKEEELVAPLLHNHDALANADIKGKLLKSEDDIESAISHNKFNDAQQIANSQRDTAEKAGSPWFAQQSKRIDAARRESAAQFRANYNFDYAMQKKEEEKASTSAFNQLMPGVISGQVTPEMLTDSLATGKAGAGKLGYANYLKLQNLQNRMEKEPDTKKALTEMWSALTPLPKTASTEMVFEDNALRENLYDAFTQGVAEKQLKGDDKTKYALELVKPYVNKAVSEKIDTMLGKPAAAKPAGISLKSIAGFFTSSGFGDEDVPRGTSAKETSGTIRVKEKSSGRTGTIPASEYDEKLYEKVQ